MLLKHIKYNIYIDNNRNVIIQIKTIMSLEQSVGLSTLQKISQLKKQIREHIINQSYHLPIYNIAKHFSFTGFKYINIAKKQIVLNLHTISQITRLLQILLIVEELIKSQQFITKRNLYYKLIHYYKMYTVVDSDLQILTFHLQTTREQLNIFSSSRCQLAGSINFQLDHQIIQCKQNSITNIPNFKKIHNFSTSCKNLIIIQKQSALFQLNQQLQKEKDYSEQFKTWLSQSIIISSKGYPDSTVRSIIENIHESMTDIYYLGDQDVYGLDILLCYAIGYNSFSTILPNVKWIQFQKLIQSAQVQMEYQCLAKQDKRKLIELLNSPFFKDLDIYNAEDQWSQKCSIKLGLWRQRLLEMRDQKRKIELQSLFKFTDDNWLQKMRITKSFL